MPLSNANQENKKKPHVNILLSPPINFCIAFQESGNHDAKNFSSFFCFCKGYSTILSRERISIMQRKCENNLGESVTPDNIVRVRILESQAVFPFIYILMVYILIYILIYTFNI